MSFSHGAETRKALSFAVERDNLLQCYDAFESTGSTHWPDVAGIYSGSKAGGSPTLNTTDGVGPNKIKYFEMGGTSYFNFQSHSQPYTCSLSTWTRINDTNDQEVICSNDNGGPVSTYYDINASGYMNFGYYANSGSSPYDGPGEAATWRTITGTGTVVDDNVWHHCVWARNDQNHKFYVDGGLDTNHTMTDIMGGAIDVIGAKWSLGSKFNGDIAHVSTYSVQLSATQVSNMYEAQRHRFGV